ncbi:transglutaminase domain-containing protein [Yeosuana marina]|uniref:transglutaminase domain-containing protein n=1 Tax=Yeosuana marina TaxID=1565536 RepID=UPI0014235432|nr:transglutaminase domain-containing protein [Yeosuana marina]
MKKPLTFLTIISVLTSCLSQENVKQKRIISAKSDYTEYKIADTWFRGQWRIAPEIEHDTLKVLCYGSKEEFKFRTDMDSIEFLISPQKIVDFYIKLDENILAHTVVEGVAVYGEELNFNRTRNNDFKFKFQKDKSKYLNELRKLFPIDDTAKNMTEVEKVLAILNWTNSRWKHNGMNSPSKNDAITILNEANEGGEFPCFAFAIVLKDQLNANGFKARTIYLKSKDAKNRKSSPGHVATEVYLNDLDKWVFLDGQFNLMPFLNNKPLNAVEFQDAIVNDFDKLELKSLSSNVYTKKRYVNFVYDYLYYFDTDLDNRYDYDDKYRVEGKSSIMLVPSGAEELHRIDFWDMDIDYCVYTNSLNDFYQKPK